MNVDIYDIETYFEAFILCALDRDTLEKRQFEISHRKNDIKELIKYLKEIKGQIGYNNINFDYPVIHWILNNYQKYNQYSLPQAICEKAQEVIKQEFSAVKYEDVLIPQLDLFKIWHYSNKARITSLKYLEFTMRMDNIEDLPYNIYEELTSEMIDNIIDYCHHDVWTTYQFYLKSTGRVDLRRKLSKKYNLPLMNRPDVGIAEDLVLDSYCKQTGKSKEYVKKLRSEYDWIQGKDVILPDIKFKTDQMQEWLIKLKDIYFKRMGGFWKGDVIELYNEKYQVGLGGIHVEQKPGVYKIDENSYIAEIDCAGMYPTFICNHGMYPAHLGKEFLTLYREIREDRIRAKKSGDKVMDAAGKLQGNGTFGKFGSDFSWLYDLKMLYTTTVNNQLFLLMLIEECGLNNLKIISANTDSITVFIKKDKLSLLESIVKEWEKISLHSMEYTPYNQIVYRDVNNYIAETTEGEIKYKGAFDTFEDKNSVKFDGWHKNHSMMIVSIALKEYFINNTPIETTIKNHNNIFDFCKVVKGIGEATFKTIQWIDRKIVETPQQKKINRYIVTIDGYKLIKILPPLQDDEGNFKKDKLAKFKKENPNQLNMFDFIPDVVQSVNRESEVEAGYKVQILNKIKSKDIKDYNINYDYYIKECYKIINSIK